MLSIIDITLQLESFTKQYVSRDIDFLMTVWYQIHIDCIMIFFIYCHSPIIGHLGSFHLLSLQGIFLEDVKQWNFSFHIFIMKWEYWIWWGAYFNFRFYQFSFPEDCYDWHFHQKCMRGPFCLFSLALDIISLQYICRDNQWIVSHRLAFSWLIKRSNSF